MAPPDRPTRDQTLSVEWLLSLTSEQIAARLAHTEVLYGGRFSRDKRAFRGHELSFLLEYSPHQEHRQKIAELLEYSRKVRDVLKDVKK